jgi:succinoglycan biosynthesis protein ExoM
VTLHITVCICTFKRPELLLRLLTALEGQDTGGKFRYSAVVADNDRAGSARAGVEAFAAQASMPVRYCLEPEQNIARVRNRALQHAEGELAAFIDDDEVPEPDWLAVMLQAMQRTGADGVLGPVNPYFDGAPPAWVKKGGFFERPVHPDGYVLRWAECRTGNVLFSRAMIEGIAEPFRPQFATAGEDMDFFRRMIDQGRRFIWCPAGAVRELIPPARMRWSFLLRRALLRGSNYPKHPQGRGRAILKSLIAVPAYVLALPLLALLGRHLLLKYLIKLCDHSARLLAFSGWSLMKERET